MNAIDYAIHYRDKGRWPNGNIEPHWRAISSAYLKLYPAMPRRNWLDITNEEWDLIIRYLKMDML